jgi:hypothetical protein
VQHLRRLALVSFVLALIVWTMAVPTIAAQSLHTRAADLRVALDRLLGEHAFLTVEAMRTGIRGGADFAAAAEALEGNTTDLQATISSVYGDAAGARFGELWRSHLGYIVDYTVALDHGDAAGQQVALDGLEDYTHDFSVFLAGANPNLTEAAVQSLLGEHVTQLEQLASYASEDYDKSFMTARHIYAHMYTVGDALSGAIAMQFPEQLPGRDVMISPALDLRVTLDRLLGEHTFLAVELMRAGFAGGAEAAAARAAVDDNSADLTEAVTSVYGDGAGTQFASLWDEHVDAYATYIKALADGDDAAADAARSTLEAYGAQFGAFLASANPNLTAGGVEELLDGHTQHLLAQADAYAAGDYSEAYQIGREAHHHIQQVSDALAIAIAEQFPEIFPALPATDLDSRPSDVVPRFALIVLVALILLAAFRRSSLLRR